MFFFVKVLKISQMVSVIKHNKIKNIFSRNFHNTSNCFLIKSHIVTNVSLTSLKEKELLSSFILKKFISQIMKDGKKFKSEKLLKKILVRISLKGHAPLNTLILAINNVKPVVDVRTIRRKGKKFKVPVPLKSARQITKSIQTLLRVSKNKLFFEEFLVDELINSMRGRSKSLKITLRLHKFAFQNRSFSNYR
jgi:small subunit ribosomal protein S7